MSEKPPGADTNEVELADSERTGIAFRFFRGAEARLESQLRARPRERDPETLTTDDPNPSRAGNTSL
jgi:hypothetical protein